MQARRTHQPLRVLLPVFLILVPLHVLPAQDETPPTRPATEQEPWLGLPVEERSPPGTVAGAEAYEARITRALERLQGEAGGAPLRKELQGQLEAVRALRRHLEALASLPERVEALRAARDKAVQARKELAARPPEQVNLTTREEVERQGARLKELQGEIQQVEDSLARYRSEQESDRAFLAGLETPTGDGVLGKLEKNLEATRSKLAEVTAQEPEGRVLRERLVRLHLEQEAARKRQDLVEARRELGFHTLRVEGATEERRLLEARSERERALLADLETRLSAQQQQELERLMDRRRELLAQIEKARSEGGAAYKIPWLEKSLLLNDWLRWRNEITELASTWRFRVNPGGDLGRAGQRARRVQSRLEDQKELEADRLRGLLAQCRQRLELLDRGREELLELRFKVDGWLGRALALKKDLAAELAAARQEARSRMPRGGGRYTSDASWDELAARLSGTLEAIISELRRLSESTIKGYREKIELQRGIVSANERQLAASLLWAREGSDISLAALGRVVGDARRLPRALKELGTNWARSWSQAVSEESRRVRVVMGGLLTVLLLGGFALVRKRLPKGVGPREGPREEGPGDGGEPPGGDPAPDGAQEGGSEEENRSEAADVPVRGPAAEARRKIRKARPPEQDPAAGKKKPHGRTASRELLVLLRRRGFSLVIALLLVLLPLVLDLPAELALPLAGIVATPFLYRFLRAFLEVLLDPAREGGPLLAMEAGVARLLLRSGRMLLLFSVVFVPAGLAMEAAAYDGPAGNPGFVELWWLVYKVGLHIVLLASIFRPGVILRIVRVQGRRARSAFAAAAVAYPLVVGVDLFIFTLSSLTYHEAARFFLGNFAATGGLVLGAWLMYRWALKAVRPGKDISRTVDLEDYESEAQYLAAGRELFFDRLVRLVLRIVFFVPAAVLVWSVWPAFVADALTEGLWGPGSVSLMDILWAGVAMTATVILLKTYRTAMKFVVMPNTQLDRGLQYTVTTLLSYAVFALGVVIALTFLRVDGSQIGWVVTALSVGIGFGLQSIVRNLVSGIILLVERPVKVGDWVVVDDKWGVVEKITMRATTVMGFNGIGMVIPNEKLIEGTLVNPSAGAPRLRTEMPVGVAYGSPVARVREVLSEVLDKHGLVLKRPQPEVFFRGFGDSSLNFELWYWTSMTSHRIRVASDIRSAVDAAFRREGIQIPFPQRDLHIRSWPVGSEADGEASGQPGRPVVDQLQGHAHGSPSGQGTGS